MFAKLSLRLINWYQNRGGGTRLLAVECNFEPSCSEYTKQAIERYGFTKGVRFGIARIRRCNQPDLPHRIDDPLPVCDCGTVDGQGDTRHV